MPTISVKGYSGQELTYENVEKVYFNSPGSTEKVPFSYGDTVENIPVTLDLAEGDQTITAPDGTLVKSAIIAKPEDLTPENVRKGKTIAGVEGGFIGDTEEITVDLSMAEGDQVIEPSAEGKVLSKVIIIKPDTLIPANIAEGVDIAGIIGTLAAGGGGGSVVIASGSFAGTGAPQIVEHGLGVVPDVFLVFSYPSPAVVGTHHLVQCISLTSAMAGHWLFSSAAYLTYRKKISSSSSDYTYNVGTTGAVAHDLAPVSGRMNCIHSADEATITVGYTANSIPGSGATYYWLAIGGLT